MTRVLFIALVLAGCRTGDNSPQPSCIYQCQNVLVEQPTPQDQLEPGAPRKRKR